MKNAFIFSAITALTAAQEIADLPSCSLQCLASAIPSLGCELTDFKCSCQKADQLTPNVTPCIQTSCADPADQSKTTGVLSAICAAAGFPIKVTAPSFSAAAEPTPAFTSEAAPEPTTSEGFVETQLSATGEPEYSAYPSETPSEYPAPSHVTEDGPNLPSSYSGLEPMPSFVDTIIVSRPSPHLTSVLGVLPPYLTSIPGLSVPAPSGTGSHPTTTSSHLPEFTGAATSVKVSVVAAGVFGLAAFVL